MDKFSMEESLRLSEQRNQAIQDKVISDHDSREMYERKRKEIELALLMRRTREEVNLSQTDVAERMHTTRSAVSRLESCGSTRHSPSIETLLKYAQALGYSVKINLVPVKS